MTNALKILYDEHEVIVSAIELAKGSAGLAESNPPKYELVVRDLLSFFRNYADQYHHHKEEQILFPALGKKNELLQEGIITEMLSNHEDFRNMLRGIEIELEKKEYKQARQYLALYGEALLDHIAVENDELFQVAEALMSEEEQERTYFSFMDCDRDLGNENKRLLKDMLEAIRRELDTAT